MKTKTIRHISDDVWHAARLKALEGDEPHENLKVKNGKWVFVDKEEIEYLKED